MNPERWKRVDELYHAARSRPAPERAAFLAEACRDDEALRREVESLLAESVSEDGFLAGPALVAAAQIADELAPAAMTGRSLGGYELQALVGAGGMGEVYRARDTKLGRDVAIKILPRAFTNDPDRLARFEREARMLAALNHPNICAIFGLEEAEGVRFLVLELVEGETLADTLAGHGSQPGGPGLPLADALAIARQIADALEAAHDKGIIHRDLKPANIKITPRGRSEGAGLRPRQDRRRRAGDAPTPRRRADADRRPEAAQGAVLGTAAYMSPEQARGLAVDKRTDIWAFGCVLYEMLTGRVAFAGDTVSDTIASDPRARAGLVGAARRDARARAPAAAALPRERPEAAAAGHRRRPDRARRERRRAAGHRASGGHTFRGEEPHHVAALGGACRARRGGRRARGLAPGAGA